MTIQDGIEFLLRMLLGVVFLRSAIPKLRHPKGFILTVLEYRIMPPALSRAYAWLVPPLELWLAIAFLTGVALELTGSIAAMLLLSFMIGISVNLIRGRDLDCGCFGATGNRVSWTMLARNAGLLSFASVLAAHRSDDPSGQIWSVHWPNTSLHNNGDLAGLAVCTAITLLLVVALPKARLFPRRSNRASAHQRNTVEATRKG